MSSNITPMRKSGDARVREVAAELGLNPETVRIMARSGDFPNAYKSVQGKINSPVRIPWSDVEDYRRKQPRVAA